jgi:ferredoxin
MNIDVAKAEVIDNIECINCQECTAICPKEGALNNTVSFHKSLRIKPLIIGIAIIVLYFGGIGIAKLTAYYTLLPEPITTETEIVDVESLKGYMTILEISTVMGIPLDKVYRRMEIPENIPSSTSVKELGGFIPGFDFHESRNLLKSE